MDGEGMYQALYRKWRPRTFGDVTGQAHITDTLRRQVETGRLSHAYLFAGTRGTGKTTAAKVLARAVNCLEPKNGEPCNQCAACLGIENGSILDVLELDAASNNGVDHVRALRDEAIYSPAAVKKRVYIVDEVHMLSTAAFNALLKILEEPPAHLMFILATTELHKVPATILSRCQRFFFKRILPEDIAARLRYVAQQEQIGLSEDGAGLLSRLADGSMRDALSLLDQCAASGAAVDLNRVREVLGLAGSEDIVQMVEAIGRGEGLQAIEILAGLYAAGKSMESVLDEISDLLRDLLMMLTAPKGGIPLLSGAGDVSTLRKLGALFTRERLIQALSVVQGAQGTLSFGGSQRTCVELCLLRLSDPTLDNSVTGLAARVEALEERLINGAPPAPAAPEISESARRAPEAPIKAKAPPEQQEKKKQAASVEPPAAEPSPAKEKPGETGNPPPGFWESLLREAKKTLDVGPHYTYLSSPELTAWRWEEGRLLLLTDSALTKNLLSQPAAFDAIRTAAKRVTGFDVPLVIRERGQDTPKNGDGDKFNNLLAVSRQLDITIE